jgi:hypothetical protein
MIIVVNHTISKPAEFWAAAQRELPRLPAGIKIHQVMPNHDGTRATCVWEGNDVAHLRAYLEAQTGAFSENDYMAVEVANGMNVPGGK